MKIVDGIAASTGLVSGPLVRLETVLMTDAQSPPGGGDDVTRLSSALDAGIADLTELLGEIDDDDASGILAFQIAMLEDEALVDPAIAGIRGGATAAGAWRAVLDEQIADYQGASDPYFRARASDLVDMRDRVLRHLAGAGDAVIPPGCIVVTEDMAPSLFLETDWTGSGLALERGSTSSHVAMLARAREVPMIVGLGRIPVDADMTALMDADTGRLTIAPDEATAAGFRERQSKSAAARATIETYRERPAVTATGDPVTVLLNVADPAEVEGLDPSFCDGIGLTRTEFLFYGAGGMPDEANQVDIYSRLVRWAAGRPVTIRTLDAGGDKPLADITPDHESNPFLGVRGVRLSLRHPDLFKVQLRALLRASAVGPVKIMIPMVTVPDEMTACRRLLDSCAEDLDGEGIDRGTPELGMMVEVPAAAIAIDQFDVDFFSIGSNDLIQYVMACGRDSADLNELARGDNPALLALIEHVASHGRRVGREVSLCGDMAADPSMVPKLLAAGLRTLSVAPASVARTKFAVARYRGA